MGRRNLARSSAGSPRSISANSGEHARTLMMSNEDGSIQVGLLLFQLGKLWILDRCDDFLVQVGVRQVGRLFDKGNGTMTQRPVVNAVDARIVRKLLVRTSCQQNLAHL